MSDKINKKNIAEDSTEVNLKTPSNFQSPSTEQELQSSTELEGNTMSARFSNIQEKITIKQANIMGNFAEVLTKNQAKNINKIIYKIGKKLETFKKSHSVLATISVNSRNTSRANASVEDGCSSSQDCQEETTDMRKGKRKHVTNFNTNKKTVRETGESHPPAEDKLSLYGGYDLDEQIVQSSTKNPKVNFANNDESEPDERDKDVLIKDVANHFSAVEKTGPPIGKNLASIMNNVMFNPVGREKLVQKLEKHPRPENLNSLKIQKCNSET